MKDVWLKGLATGGSVPSWAVGVGWIFVVSWLHFSDSLERVGRLLCFFMSSWNFGNAASTSEAITQPFNLVWFELLSCLGQMLFSLTFSR